MESLYSLGEYILHIGVCGEDERVGEAISKEVAGGMKMVWICVYRKNVVSLCCF